MKCEKCGKTIEKVLVNTFLRNGSDFYYPYIIKMCDECAAYFDTDNNWTGYELTENEQMETIKCPHCGEFPFNHKEVQVHEIVRVVCFRGGGNE